MVQMHACEFYIDIEFVRKLISEQFPDWAALSLQPVPSVGTDNALYRLGDDRVVRLPRIDWAAEAVDKEFAWIPKIAPLVEIVYYESLFQQNSITCLALPHFADVSEKYINE